MRDGEIRKEAPLLAIVGRPNVGKSTLFNRLVGANVAIVEDQPGVTRDRRYGEAEYGGVRFRVVDTGGLDLPGARRESLKLGVLRQAERAIEEADVILFLIDGREGLLPEDREVAERLRRSGKPVLYAANKIDSAKQEAAAAELFALGAETAFGISASHGRGIADLLDEIVARLPAAEAAEPAEAEAPIRIAIVGRPNAGKSSLVNALCGAERMLVDEAPGTTRDPVDTLVEIEGHRYLLIDTAGLRRRVRVHEAADKIAMAMAEKVVGRADVAVLVIDAQAGIAEQDARIAGIVEEAGRALVLCYNKRDLIDAEGEKRLHRERDRILQFVPWALSVSCSARTGYGTKRLLDQVRRAHAAYTKRVSTGALNRFFAGIVERHPPPLYQGHPIRLYYITQAQARPPTFVVSVNYPQGMHFSYRRYLQNQLRETFGFEGTPIRLVARAHRGQKRAG
jgi:GTP-binding protein